MGDVSKFPDNLKNALVGTMEETKNNTGLVVNLAMNYGGRDDIVQAVNKLKKEYDDVSGITWYYNPYFTHYNNTNRTSIYIGSKETSVWLRLKMSYTGDNWIFFENAYLSYDENTRKIIFDKYDNKESDNSGGSVWEWIDVSVDEYLLAYLEEMIKGKSIKMRLDGKYTKTRNLSANEINGIKDVLLAYDVLKNEITNKLKRELTNK